MDKPLVIIIGVSFIVLILMIPRLLRKQNDKDEKRELHERGRTAVLMELDEKIKDQLAHIATLEANAGVIYGAEADEAIHVEHRKLRRLYRSRDIAANYPEAHP